MENCIFCKIINHEIPSKIIYEDEQCMAFLDITQVTNGHTLIIPKMHAADYLSVDQNVLAHISKVAQIIANQLKTKLNASGINILTNAGQAAGQEVFHFHMHLIPRFNENDGIEIKFNRLDDFDLEAIYNAIKR